jgi:hypothetical protein
MKRSLVWLVVTGLAFAAWISYLFYLTRQVERPSIILSRPQFLIAEGVIIGKIDNKNGPVIVDEVFFAPKDVKLKAGDQIDVENLSGCWHDWTSEDSEAEWRLHGEFILPLYGFRFNPEGDEWSAVVVALPPPSPGLRTGTRIYPKTPGTMEQLKAIPIGK